VAGGFAFNTVLELAVGLREWREVLKNPNDQIHFDQHWPLFFGVTVAPLMSIWVGFETCAYLVFGSQGGQIPNWVRTG
jgi:hypothetical protein